MQEIKEISIEQIDVGEYDVRMESEDDTIVDLAASIRRIGIIVPLSVVKNNDRFTLVAGHRRLASAKQIGLSIVPCIVLDSLQGRENEVSFAENIFRRDLTPVELASALKDYLEQSKQGVEEVARMLNRSGEYVRRHIAILSWPIDVQKAVHEGWLSMSAAENLSCVKNDEYRDFLLGHARTSGATARLTSAWLQAYEAMQPVSTAITTEPSLSPDRPAPLVPQAPCIVCGDIFRTDELCHVPCCGSCIKRLRNLSSGQDGR